MKFSVTSPLAILREHTVMCIPQVTLQFCFVSLYGRQQKSEFEDDDSIIGIDLRWSISTIMGFSVCLIWNLTDLMVSDLTQIALFIKKIRPILLYESTQF